MESAERRSPPDMGSREGRSSTSSRAEFGGALEPEPSRTIMTETTRIEGPAAALRRSLPDDLAEAFGIVSAEEPFGADETPPGVSPIQLDTLIGAGLIEFDATGEGSPMARLRYRLSPLGCHVHHAWAEVAKQATARGARAGQKRGLFGLTKDELRTLAESFLCKTHEEACEMLETPCRVWDRSLNASGYATVHVAGTSERAHRVTLAAYKGLPPPAKALALHLCGRKDCLNPEHLEWGDARTNAEQHYGHQRLRAGQNGANGAKSQKANGSGRP